MMHATFGKCEWLANVLSTNYFRHTDENLYNFFLFLVPRIIPIFRNFVSQNEAKNAGCSRKNAGMREIDRNAGFPARLRDG